MPGEASPAASFAPRVYIPLQNLAQTNLLKPGSLARYLNFVKFAPGIDVAPEVQKLAPQIEKVGLEYDTVAKRKKDLGEALDNLYRFLNLVGFIALLLGAVGVGSAIQAHLQQKVRTGRGAALSRRRRSDDSFGLPAAGDRARRRRRDRGRGPWPNDSPTPSRHAAKIPALCTADRDCLAARFARNGTRPRGLHSFRAPAAAAFPARLAAAHFARGGGCKIAPRTTRSRDLACLFRDRVGPDGFRDFPGRTVDATVFGSRADSALPC